SESHPRISKDRSYHHGRSTPGPPNDRRSAASALIAMLHHGFTPPERQEPLASEASQCGGATKRDSRSAAAAPCWAATFRNRIRTAPHSADRTPRCTDPRARSAPVESCTHPFSI